MRVLICSLMLLVCGFSQTVLAQPAPQQHPAASWTPASKALLEQAQHEGIQKQGNDLSNVHYMPTSDGKSYLLVWHPHETPPKKWLVSLPGTHGYATRDFEVWAPALKDRDIGFISIQWWLGQGDRTEDYYRPNEIYRELDQALNRLDVAPDTALLQGFSRGSANIYAVAALDRNRGHKYFSTVVANSGGVAIDYPPTREIVDGLYGTSPFTGTQWITSCGARDENPDRDGCPAMQRTAKWLEQMGGKVVLQIEDAQAGHGALNTNLDNARQVLDLYMGQ